MQDRISEQRPPRTYAVCWVCKRRSTHRELFYSDPFAPVMGVAYRCLTLEECSERRRNREAAAAERRQAKQAADLAAMDQEWEQATDVAAWLASDARRSDSAVRDNA